MTDQPTCYILWDFNFITNCRLRLKAPFRSSLMRTLYKFLLTVLCLAVFTSHSTVLASAQTNTLNVLLQHIARNSDNVPLYIFTASNNTYQGGLTKALKYDAISTIETKVLQNCLGSWVSGRSTKEVTITFKKADMSAGCSSLISTWLPKNQMNKALTYGYLVLDPNFTLSTDPQKSPIATLGNSSRLQYIFSDLPQTGLLPYRETVGRVCTALTQAQRSTLISQMQLIHGNQPLWVVDAWWLRNKTFWYSKTLDSTRTWTGQCAPVAGPANMNFLNIYNVFSR